MEASSTRLLKAGNAVNAGNVAGRLVHLSQRRAGRTAGRF
jgi:hypothetical protein